MGIGGLELLKPETGEPELSEEDPWYTHIVGPIWEGDVKIDGPTRVTEAAVLGIPIEAICGFVWVPSRDPNRYPLCPKCKAIKDAQPN